MSAAWISFFAFVLTRTSCALRPSRRRMARVFSSGTQTPSSWPRREELRQRSGVEAVGLRPRGADPGVGGRDTRPAWRHGGGCSAPPPRRCRKPRAPPGRPLRGFGQIAPTPGASSRSAAPSGPRRPRRSRPRRSRGGYRDRSISSLHLLVVVDLGGQVDNDSDVSVLKAQPGRSQGRPLKSRALGPSRKKRPVQPAFSSKPLSQSAGRDSAWQG